MRAIRLNASASEPKLGRPASAPRLACSATGLQASRGFSASLSTASLRGSRPQTSSGAASAETLFEVRDLPALAGGAESYELPGAVGERLVRELQPPAQHARRKGTQAWVQGDLQRAIQEFSSAIDLEPVGSRARSDALQLRCAGLLRAGRHEEALTDSTLVVQSLPANGHFGDGACATGAPAAATVAAVAGRVPGSPVPGRSAAAEAKLAAAAAAVAEYKVAGHRVAARPSKPKPKPHPHPDPKPDPDADPGPKPNPEP